MFLTIIEFRWCFTISSLFWSVCVRMQHIMMVVKLLIKVAVPDVPTGVELSIHRVWRCVTLPDATLIMLCTLHACASKLCFAFIPCLEWHMLCPLSCHPRSTTFCAWRVVCIMLPVSMTLSYIARCYAYDVMSASKLCFAFILLRDGKCFSHCHAMADATYCAWRVVCTRHGTGSTCITVYCVQMSAKFTT